MFIKTLIKQGNELVEQDNEIKQLKEENNLLRNEIDFRTDIERQHERAFNKIMFLINASDEIESWNNDENYKNQVRNKNKNEIRNIIKNELINTANID